MADEALMRKHFWIAQWFRDTWGVCILLQSQEVNTVTGQFVLRQGAEDCVSYNTMLGRCALIWAQFWELSSEISGIFSKDMFLG